MSAVTCGVSHGELAAVRVPEPVPTGGLTGLAAGECPMSVVEDVSVCCVLSARPSVIGGVCT